MHGRAGLRLGQWKITFVPPPAGPGEWELFDLATDPGETRDLRDQEPDKFKQLAAEWDK